MMKMGALLTLPTEQEAKAISRDEARREIQIQAKDFEALTLAGKLRHTGHPVLRWCVGNTMIEADSQSNYRPSKKKSTEKIDLAVAAIMATARARVQAVANSSVYEERGLRFL